jgi:hypothetical protein
MKARLFFATCVTNYSNTELNILEEFRRTESSTTSLWEFNLYKNLPSPLYFIFTTVLKRTRHSVLNSTVLNQSVFLSHWNFIRNISLPTTYLLPVLTISTFSSDSASKTTSSCLLYVFSTSRSSYDFLITSPNNTYAN